MHERFLLLCACTEERHGKKAATYKPRGEPSLGSKSAGTFPLNFQPPKLREMNICCWNHPAPSALLWQPEWTNKPLCSSHALSTHSGFVSNSCQHMTWVPLSASNQRVSPETNFPLAFLLIKFSLHWPDFCVCVCTSFLFMHLIFTIVVWRMYYYNDTHCTDEEPSERLNKLLKMNEGNLKTNKSKRKYLRS